MFTETNCQTHSTKMVANRGLFAEDVCPDAALAICRARTHHRRPTLPPKKGVTCHHCLDLVPTITLLYFGKSCLCLLALANRIVSVIILKCTYVNLRNVPFSGFLQIYISRNLHTFKSMLPDSAKVVTCRYMTMCSYGSRVL